MVARATVKDFFGGPPHHTYQHISPDVKCMNVETAKTYTFHEASHLNGYPAKTIGKYLTVSNVLEELKYSYTKVAKIELTDGWYAIDAILDVPCQSSFLRKSYLL
ncbi:hypothetical protein FRX31_009953, partial [Thalictrum thalictroides]